MYYSIGLLMLEHPRRPSRPTYQHSLITGDMGSKLNFSLFLPVADVDQVVEMNDMKKANVDLYILITVLFKLTFLLFFTSFWVKIVFLEPIWDCVEK